MVRLWIRERIVAAMWITRLSWRLRIVGRLWIPREDCGCHVDSSWLVSLETENRESLEAEDRGW